MTTVEEHVNSLKTYGVTVIEKAISEDLVERCKKSIFDYFSDKNNWCTGYNEAPQSLKSNGFNYEKLKTCSEVLESQKILDVMNSLTNNRVRWPHHCDVHLNFPGAKDFHTDEQVRLWPKKTINDVWVGDKEYEVYRCGTYLTPHTEQDGPPFYVKPQSHTTSYTNIPYSDAYEVNADVGDVVIFHARIRHKGGISARDRATMFWAFAEDNLHSVYHSMAAIKRVMGQNKETEYKLSKHLTDMFDKHNITYDIDDNLLEKFLSQNNGEPISNEY